MPKRNLSTAAVPDSPPDETAILARLRRGDSDAAHDFYRLYSLRIFRFILHALGTGAEADAEDVLQDTMIALAEALPFFRGDSSLFTYACAIAHRKVMSAIRARARRKAAAGRLAHEPESHGGASGEEHDVRRALDTLSAEHREVLLLKYVEEMTVAEIARALALSEHAVESRLARARRSLSKALEGNR